MNKLVSYDSESDDETSPKRPGSSKSESSGPKRNSRKDSEFWSDAEKSSAEETSDHEFCEFEPPPPKRRSQASTPSPDTEAEILHVKDVHKGNLPIAHSTSSLVSLGDETDEFEREYQTEKLRPRKPSRIEGGVVEPSPPKRQTVDEMSVDRSPDESDVDQALEEGLSALKEKTRYMEEGVATPRSQPDSDEVTPQTPQTPRTPKTPPIVEEETIVEEDLVIPPSPPGHIDPEVQKKYDRFWKIKETGRDMNALLKNRKEFKNPAIYEFLIKKFGLDEIGSNFPKSVFDPSAFEESSYYEELAAQQKKAMDAQEAKATKKAANVKAKIDEAIKQHEERKTRFEKKK